jgi:hypothetical protein
MSIVDKIVAAVTPPESDDARMRPDNGRLRFGSSVFPNPTDRHPLNVFEKAGRYGAAFPSVNTRTSRVTLPEMRIETRLDV